MSDELKSAVELAMERFGREEDEVTPLTDAQKALIAEVRSRHQALIAQAEITHQSESAKSLAAGDPSGAEEIRTRFLREKQRLEEKMEREVAKVRSSDQTDA